MTESKAKKYNKIKLIIGISKGILSWLLILFFVISGLSDELVDLIFMIAPNDYLRFFIFILATGLVGSIIFLPVNFYTGYLLEHKFGLSNQTISKWIWENLKSLFVGGLIGIPILFIFFYALNTYGDYWWLPFSIILFLISVVLAKILPIVILPIFYKVLPLEDEDLKSRIMKLSENVKINVENVFKFDMSKNTKKANAAFTGLGKTKKIILGDTLLENFSNDEIETVIAHEIGHFKHKHIRKNILISTLFSFLTFYLMAVLYKISIPLFGFEYITEIAALPILSLWAVLIGVVQTPISNGISRKFEYEADKYAVEETGKAKIFIEALKKLNEQNLGDPDPHPLVEWYSYSHPSIKKRIAFIESISKT